jgi:serine/threonine-protein kinase
MKVERDSRIGKYIIRERIGVGGMGAVYRAWDPVLKRSVAIKTILADKLADREIMARFRLEAEAISQIDYPHIVSLKDFSEGDPTTGEPPYMVMELLQGQSLQSLIAKGPLPVDRVATILLETCAAVSVCHRRGIVHRDLKGTNIFIAEYDGAEVVKVLDFGIAKVWADGRRAEMDDRAEVTRKGVAIGTPEYFAPEILRGQPANPATDQYALGVVMYAALTGGRKPFEVSKHGEHRDLQLLQAILKGDHVGVRSHRPELPAELEAVIERALNHDPNERFASVHELGEALLPWASPDVRARWTRHFTTAPRPIRPHESLVASPAGAIKLVDATSVDPPRPPPTATSSTTRQVGSREIRDLLVAEGELRGERIASRRAGTDDVTQQDRPLRSISIDVNASMGGAIPVARDDRDRLEPIDARPNQSAPEVRPGEIPVKQVRSPVETSARRRSWPYWAIAAVIVAALGAVFASRGAGRPAATGLPPAAASMAAVPVRPPSQSAPEVHRGTATAPPQNAVGASASPIATAPVVLPSAAPPADRTSPKSGEGVDGQSRGSSQQGARTSKPQRRRRLPAVDENGIGIPTD